jgi:hypothetical protein
MSPDSSARRLVAHGVRGSGATHAFPFPPGFLAASLAGAARRRPPVEPEHGWVVVAARRAIRARPPGGSLRPRRPHGTARGM